jgi:hypothetical protein
VGGQAVEDEAKLAFGGQKGHFVTIIGPGEATFGEGTDGGFKNIANGMSISARYMIVLYSALIHSVHVFFLSNPVFVCFSFVEVLQVDVLVREVQPGNYASPGHQVGSALPELSR